MCNRYQDLINQSIFHSLLSLFYQRDWVVSIMIRCFTIFRIYKHNIHFVLYIHWIYHIFMHFFSNFFNPVQKNIFCRISFSNFWDVLPKCTCASAFDSLKCEQSKILAQRANTLGHLFQPFIGSISVSKPLRPFFIFSFVFKSQYFFIFC